MNDRMIWVVRLIGIIVFLVLMYLLMSLHARLVKMNEETPKAAMKTIRDCELRIADCEATERVEYRLS